jgi:hypothetical protein
MDCFQLSHFSFLESVARDKGTANLYLPYNNVFNKRMPIALCVPCPTLPSPHQRSSTRTQPPHSSTRGSTLTSPFGDPCVARVSAEGGQFGTGAGNETMLVTAISLATDATLLADDRQIVNLPAQRGLLQMRPCGRLTDIELFGHRHEVA